jgi:hypothetical protein
MNDNILSINKILNINNINSNYVDSIADIPLLNGNLSFFQINIRSINNHFNELAMLLGSIKNYFSIIVLCETWLLNDVEFTLNGYKSINSLGTLNKSDGVSKLIKESLNILQIEKNVILNCNSIHLKIKSNELLFSLIFIYRSPNDNLENVINNFDFFLSQNKNNYLNILCGDINIDKMKISNISNNYLNVLAKHEYISCINNFTRVTESSNTCIDHIFVKNVESNKISSNILRCDITDHYAKTLMLSDEMFKVQNNCQNVKYKKKINIELLNKLIILENWCSTMSFDDVDSMLEVFNSKINEFIYHSTISVNKFKSKKMSKLKEWITTGIITSIRNKEKLFAKLKLRPFDTRFKQFYNKYRNILNVLIRKAKQLFYQGKLLRAQSDVK